MHDETEGSGYKKPPKNKRFAKGKSGNPKGRPSKKPKRAADILNRDVSAEFGGELVKVPITEAALLSLFNQAMKGDGDVAAAAAFLKHSSKFEFDEVAPEPCAPITRVILDPYICDPLLFALGIIKQNAPGVDSKLGDDDEDELVLMELWVLEEALKRHKSRTLNHAHIIARSTVDPEKAAEIIKTAGY